MKYTILKSTDINKIQSSYAQYPDIDITHITNIIDI